MAIIGDFLKIAKNTPRATRKHLSLGASSADFIPMNDAGRTLTTRPLSEEAATIDYNYRDAAIALITNPLIYSAQRTINDTLADARFYLATQDSLGIWREDASTWVTDWLEAVNSSMDIEELLRAYATHLKTFGVVRGLLFQAGDQLPSGLMNTVPNQFDIVYPARLQPDYRYEENTLTYLYEPIHALQTYEVPNAGVFSDADYNPLVHSQGAGTMRSQLGDIVDLDLVYKRELVAVMHNHGSPAHVLIKKVSLNADGLYAVSDVSDDMIDAAVQKVVQTVGINGRRQGGWVGLRGDWDIKDVGSPLKDLINKDLVYFIESRIAMRYGIPASVFWIGLENSNQRASRQSDSIDFYTRTIHPLLKRFTKRLNQFLMPRFFGKNSKHKLVFDTSAMPAAQQLQLERNREIERRWQVRLVKRGATLDALQLGRSGYTTEELEAFYDGSNNQGMNAGAGQQSPSLNNGLE